jgi:ATP/maltotriose-dependent transcriptional regulator MalT/DNA-binding SARP family transcriptional activator
MEQEMPLLRGKITPPPLPEVLVPRPRLEESIHRRLNALPVLVVCATAGAGKSTAVRVAFRETSNLAWLTVDTADSSPGRLLTYLAASVAHFAPSVAELVQTVLAAQVPHNEAAGLMIEALAEVGPVTLVIDQLDRISAHYRPMEVIDGLVQFAPRNVRIVLISRTAITLASSAAPGSERIDYVIDRELAFNNDEAAIALEQAGGSTKDVEVVMRSTGGWVVGVLFAGSTAEPIRMALQPEIDPLHAYLWAHVVQGLSPELREFAISTSLLVTVDAKRATALGLERAEHYLTQLRAHRIPAVWEPGGKTVRYHRVLRDYLLVLLERRPRAEVVALRTRFGRLLAAEGFMIEATAELLAVGAFEDAMPFVEAATVALIDRLDFDVVEEWLETLTDHGQSGSSPLTTAELLLAVAREEYWRGVRIADQLEALGQREPLAAVSSRAAAMMVWCYYHACRTEDIAAIVAVARPGAELDAAKYLLTLMDSRPEELRPTMSLTGGSVAGLVARLHYWRGWLTQAAAPDSSTSADAVVRPWQIAALRAMGELEQAHQLYRRVEAAGMLTAGLQAVVGAELFTDLGRDVEARVCIAKGRAEARRIGSSVWDLFAQLSEAKLELRLRHDPKAARTVLDILERDPLARVYDSTAEQIDTWYGLTHLLLGEYDKAQQRLERAVESMRVSGRFLELPTAAIYLAEAAWHCGDIDGADLYPDIALEAAKRQGTDEVLLRALREFPEVLSRRIDGLADADTAWNRLGVKMLGAQAATPVSSGSVLEITEFGATALSTDGKEVRPRIAKCYELVAYLAASGSPTATRVELLGALFDDADTRATRSYLRQVIHQLRSVLPEGAGPFIQDDRVILAEGFVLRSESQRFEHLAQRAGSNDPATRLEELEQALALFERGPYLPKARSFWAEERRANLAAMAAGLRFEAAGIAFGLGAFARADALAGVVVEEQPLREAAWRLRMRIAAAVGSPDEVLESYRACVEALRVIGAEPARETRLLLDQLR